MDLLWRVASRAYGDGWARRLMSVAALTCMSGHASAIWYEEKGCPPQIDNAYKCDVYLEKVVLGKFPEVFSRNGGRLTVMLENGRKKIYANNDDRLGDASRLYAVVRAFPTVKYALIGSSYREGGNSHLLNLVDGSIAEVNGWVVLSPDNQRFVATHSDIDVGYSPNLLAVYRVGATGLVREFWISPDWGASNAKWVDSRSISFRKEFRKPMENPGVAPSQPVQQTLLLRFVGTDISKGGKWKIR